MKLYSYIRSIFSTSCSSAETPIETEVFPSDIAGMAPEEAEGFRAMNERIRAKLRETQAIADANPLRKK